MPRHAKSYAREKVIKALYQRNYTSVDFEDPLALKIYTCIIENEDNINAKIKKNLKKWDIKGLNRVDLSILQMGTYEIIYDETPSAIIVSECLFFADLYTEEKSRNFIHHVLDKVLENRTV